MNLPQVFRDAARFCERGGNEISGPDKAFDGACDVLGSPSYKFNNLTARILFREWFVEPDGYFLMRDEFADEEDPETAAQECRILALCFAAAMAETGDLP